RPALLPSWRGRPSFGVGLFLGKTSSGNWAYPEVSGYELVLSEAAAMMLATASRSQQRKLGAVWAILAKRKRLTWRQLRLPWRGGPSEAVSELGLSEPA